MAIAVLAETPNMTAAQFDAAAAEAGLSRPLPDGCLVHIAGIGPDGSTWRARASGRHPLRPSSLWTRSCCRQSIGPERRRSGERL